jgi:glutamate:GABA antiporter
MINKKVGLFVLIMLITGSIDSVRNLPATAFFGPALVFFFVIGALFFLLPGAFVSADLAEAFPERSGIYQWVKMAFGKKTAFLAVWLQWVNTLVWFPTMLAFIGGTFAYFINPALAQNNHFILALVVIVFWSVTLINLQGVSVSARFAGICTFIGLIIPMILIIGLSVLWLIKGAPLQVAFTAKNFLPDFSNMNNWFSLTAVMTSCVGIELTAVHMMNIQNGCKNFPKAMFISVLIILATMIMGSLAIVMVVPAKTIQLNQGLVQAMQIFLDDYHLIWLVMPVIALVLIGSVGELVNWMISPTRGLFQATEDQFLPNILRKTNKHGIAHNIAILQAIVVTIIAMAFLYMPSVNGSYWLLTALSTQLYMLMYVLMFVAAIRIKKKFPERVHMIKFLRVKGALTIMSVMGLIGCLVTLYIGFVPPVGINVGSPLHYETMFVGGLIVMVVPCLIFYAYHAKQSVAE